MGLASVPVGVEEVLIVLAALVKLQKLPR